MPKRNIKSFQFVKLVLLMLCVVIVLTVITFGLVILWSIRIENENNVKLD